MVRSGALWASATARTDVGTNLCHGGEAGVGLGGADLQPVQVWAALVVERPGQAERAAVLVDAEHTPGIHQQHVGQAFLLEGHSRNRGNTEDTHRVGSVPLRDPVASTQARLVTAQEPLMIKEGSSWSQSSCCF